jgi:chromosomal replication initiation ATPase DnaA
MAKEAIDLGGRVYLNSSHAFIETLKGHFTKKDIGFIAQYADNHFFMLDDFQIFNKDFSRGYYDTLFEVINSLMLKGRNIIFCSDINMAHFALLPDRIISRLHMSYAADIKLPDMDLKKQFLEYYAKKIEIEDKLTEDAKQIVLHSTRTLRDVAGALHICLMLNKDGELQVRDLFNKLKEVGGRKGDILDSVYAILTEYYGVSEKETAKNKKGYRPRSLGKVNSVLYYLFHDKGDVRTLRQRLEIEAKRHSYTLEYGQKNFNEIKDREIRDQIETIIQEREDRTVSLFNDEME